MHDNGLDETMEKKVGKVAGGPCVLSVVEQRNGAASDTENRTGPLTVYVAYMLGTVFIYACSTSSSSSRRRRAGGRQSIAAGAVGAVGGGHATLSQRRRAHLYAHKESNGPQEGVRAVKQPTAWSVSLPAGPTKPRAAHGRGGVGIGDTGASALLSLSPGATATSRFSAGTR
jgi:hypothetical protein